MIRTVIAAFRRLAESRLLTLLTAGLTVCLIAVVLLAVIPSEERYTAAPAPAEPLVITGPTLERSLPQRLIIPSLNLDTVFTDALGLTDSGEIQVPDSYEGVGWYQFGPTPGEAGPAVVLGHVDSETGPAIFFSLGQLAIGAEIIIERADGSTAKFAVTELERPSQSAFPTTKVYGDIDHAGLRLITCSGIFVRGQDRYTHNLVVYARLIE